MNKTTAWLYKGVKWADASNRNLGLVSVLLSALFLSFASVYTSPFNPYYGSDAAVFMVIGKGITKGLVPYVDLYDHKGPLLFFFNALGYWLYDGKLGVLLVQILFFAVVLYLVYKMARLFVQAPYVWGVQAAFCYYYITMVEGGNLSEEWSLLFSVLPMYLALRFLQSETKLALHPWRYSFIYGVCLGVQGLIRLNNASILCGIVLAFIILLLRKRAYQALFINAVMVLLGAVVAITPVVIYFVANHAWVAFIEAAFIDNFVYAFHGAQTKTWFDVLTVLLRLLLYPISLLLSYHMVKTQQIKGSVALLIVCMGSVSAPLLFLGYGYLHYFLVFAPMMVLILSVWMKAYLVARRQMRHPILSAICVLLIAFAPFSYRFARQVGVNIMMDFFAYNQAEITAVDTVMAHIPQEQRDSVWAYDVTPRFYLYADVLPCYTYFVSQSFHSKAAPDIAAQIDAMMLDDSPQWIVLGTDVNNISSKTMQDVLAESYTLQERVQDGLHLYLYEKI